MAAVGTTAMGIVDLGATVLAYPGEIHAATFARLVLLSIAMFAIAWLGFTFFIGLAKVGARAGLYAYNRGRGRRWAGLFVREAGPSSASPLVPWLWGLLVGAVVFVAISTPVTFKFVTHFKEQKLLSLLLALVHLGIIGVAATFTLAAALLIRKLSRVVRPRLGGFDPTSSLAAAVVTLTLLVVAVGKVAVVKMPQLAPLVPWRHLIAAVTFAGGAWAGSSLLARRVSLLPVRRPHRLVAGGAIAFVLALLVPVTLFKVGADPETKYVAITSSPPLRSLIDLVRRANDFDGDGFGSLLGENDCGPFDKGRYPGARDIPDNQIDENCDGRDFSLANLPVYKKGERMEVPPAFAGDWNILLLTIDTVRYDHTGFGGYRKGPKARNTTPNLDKLVERSVSFAFANAPSAGTMASIPAILTSKFFHSGIALDENVKHRMPPRLKPQNVLISEILKRDNYQTGAILTHEYFNDWGMEQGFDSYDNEIGKDPDPYRVSSHLVTDRAIAWISRNATKKWFLWAHYIDPHGRYVAHPGDTSFGTSEEDLYDGELAYTDKHVGRLLDELARMPGGDKTIIVITSDHGDAFNEHGFINHGQALYRELLHVPLIVYVPNIVPRVVDGPVTPLDIVPTVADLAGIDVKDLSFEGESLVPQLFYGRDASDRVVFSETNWPKPLRAVVTADYKAVYNLENNLYEFYDLREDPWEKKNIANSKKDELAKVKPLLEDWLERVYYSRDAATNQAAANLADTLLTEAPKPKFPVSGVTFDDGRIEVLGFTPEAESYQAGDKVVVEFFFRANDKPSDNFRIQFEGWMAGDLPEAAQKTPVRSSLGFTRNGLFPTGRWRKGEYVRDRMGIVLPPTYSTGTAFAIGLRMTKPDNTALVHTGPAPENAPASAFLGKLPLKGVAPPTPPTPAPPKKK